MLTMGAVTVYNVFLRFANNTAADSVFTPHPSVAPRLECHRE